MNKGEANHFVFLKLFIHKIFQLCYIYSCFGPLAQRLEQSPHKRLVPGSNLWMVHQKKIDEPNKVRFYFYLKNSLHLSLCHDRISLATEVYPSG